MNSDFDSMNNELTQADQLLYDIDRLQDEEIDPPLEIPTLPPLITTPLERRNANFGDNQQLEHLNAEIDNDIDAAAFISKTGKPYGHGLFITYPQTMISTIEDAKRIWIQIDMAIRNLNKNLHDC
jgi:hypothetical protein